MPAVLSKKHLIAFLPLFIFFLFPFVNKSVSTLVSGEGGDVQNQVPTDQSGSGLNAEYYNGLAFTGTPERRIDQTIHFDWGSQPPSPTIDQKSFSVRWQGELLPQATEWVTFTTLSDDGIRLYVDNQLIIDNWSAHTETRNSGSISLTKDQPVSIKVEYFQSGDVAVAELYWQSDSMPYQIVPSSVLSTQQLITPTPTIIPDTPTPTPTVTAVIKKTTPIPTATPTPGQPANQNTQSNTSQNQEKSQQSSSNRITSFITYYGWADNSPPGTDIAYPGINGAIHSKAGGTGTYSDPITFASDPNTFPVGTKLYIPFLKKYVIMEDICGGCSNNKEAGKYHIDIWMNSDDSHKDELLSCENSLTRGQESIEQNPTPDRPVNSTPLFDTGSGTCLTP